jgi:hypothetical protein
VEKWGGDHVGAAPRGRGGRGGGGAGAVPGRCYRPATTRPPRWVARAWAVGTETGEGGHQQVEP